MDIKWLCIFFSIAAIAMACGSIFSTLPNDPLSQQIKEIGKLHITMSNKEKLIGELVAKYNSCNTNQINKEIEITN